MQLNICMQRNKLFFILAGSFLVRNLPDKVYLSLLYKRKMGKRLDLRPPRTFTEKIQWLKLNYRFDIMTQCSDKYEVRKFVEDKIGPELLKKLYGVYEKVEDIDIDAFPEAFVLKINHGSGQNIFCKKKSELDWNYSRNLLKKYLKTNHYFAFREWGYKNVAPRVICEEHLTKNGETLYEYGFYCYDGVARVVEINEYTPGLKRVNMFDLDLNLLENKYSEPPLPRPVKKPPQFERMIEYAAILSSGFPFVRVDFICVNNRIYFGEMTFYPLGGLARLDPQSFDSYLGSFFKLPV
ncbi:MAG: hypothetical protein APR62_04890 [Smithella sp. SDB]|nr:MAG: hypothetical protein APR62_04890 [Smithella sp. SDB]